jgi:hypothetical protein
VLDETPGAGYVVRNLRLEFGPDGKATMRAQVMIPDGKGAHPVLISPNLPGWGPPCCAGDTSLQATRLTTEWMTQPHSRRFIPNTILPCCRAVPGPLE